VADQHRRLLELADQAPVVVDDLVDAQARRLLGGITNLLDISLLAGPLRRGDGEASLAEIVGAVLPAACGEPGSLDQQQRISTAGGAHDETSFCRCGADATPTARRCEPLPSRVNHFDTPLSLMTPGLLYIGVSQPPRLVTPSARASLSRSAPGLMAGPWRKQRSASRSDPACSLLRHRVIPRSSRRRPPGSPADTHESPQDQALRLLLDNGASRVHPAGGRRRLRPAPGDPRNHLIGKLCSRRESPPVPAQPASGKAGLSRRRSRVRVPSLPLHLRLHVVLFALRLRRHRRSDAPLLPQTPPWAACGRRSLFQPGGSLVRPARLCVV
jgi:hypothetical protein